MPLPTDLTDIAFPLKYVAVLGNVLARLLQARLDLVQIRVCKFIPVLEQEPL